MSPRAAKISPAPADPGLEVGRVVGCRRSVFAAAAAAVVEDEGVAASLD